MERGNAILQGKKKYLKLPAEEKNRRWQAIQENHTARKSYLSGRKGELPLEM